MRLRLENHHRLGIARMNSALLSAQAILDILTQLAAG